MKAMKVVFILICLMLAFATQADGARRMKKKLRIRNGKTKATSVSDSEEDHAENEIKVAIPRVAFTENKKYIGLDDLIHSPKTSTGTQANLHTEDNESGDELVIDEDNSRTYNVSMEKNTLIEILLEKLPRDIFSRETIQHMVNSLEKMTTPIPADVDEPTTIPIKDGDQLKSQELNIATKKPRNKMNKKKNKALGQIIAGDLDGKQDESEGRVIDDFVVAKGSIKQAKEKIDPETGYISSIEGFEEEVEEKGEEISDILPEIIDNDDNDSFTTEPVESYKQNKLDMMNNLFKKLTIVKKLHNKKAPQAKAEVNPVIQFTGESLSSDESEEISNEPEADISKKVQHKTKKGNRKSKKQQDDSNETDMSDIGEESVIDSQEIISEIDENSKSTENEEPIALFPRNPSYAKVPRNGRWKSRKPTNAARLPRFRQM